MRDGQLTATFRHPTFGEFRVVASGVTVESSTAESSSAGDLDDEVRGEVEFLAKEGSWSVLDTAGRVFATLRPDGDRRWRPPPAQDRAQAFAALAAELAQSSAATIALHHSSWARHSSARLTADSLTVSRSALDGPAGSCAACGSTRFVLQMPVSAAVEVTGGGQFQFVAGDVASWAATAVVRNVLVAATCSGCSTPHPAVHMGALGGTVGDVSLSDHPSVADLLEGR